MRGDSRRDLYAKTLALCGLGLLAGTGALVDYWPVGMKLPLAVTDPAVRPSPPAFLPAVPSAEAVLLASENAEAVETSTTRRGRSGTESRRERRTLAVVAGVSPVSLAMAAVDDSAITLNAPPPRLPIQLVARHHIPAFGDTPMQLTPPGPPRLADGGASGVSGDDGEHGRLAGAFLRTGTSIARTGLKTGASVADAFRVFGGVVRRAF